MIGLARNDDQEQEGDLAASGGDVWEGPGFYVVLPLANLLHGVRGVVCV